MIQYADVLQTIAEVSIAFVGFAGVVAAFSRFRLHPRARFYRVRTMVGVGLFCLLFSLLPLVLSQFEISAEANWRVASLALALGTAAMLLWALRGVRPLYRDGVLQTQRFTLVMASVFGTAIFGLMFGALGSWPAIVPGLYVSVLFLGLLLCSYYFFMLVSAIEIEREP